MPRTNTESAPGSVSVVACLAPAIPSVSETFVLEEIRSLRAAGVLVDIFSVHEPNEPATGRLNPPVTYLYRSNNKLRTFFGGVVDWLKAKNSRLALRSLIKDMSEQSLSIPDCTKLTFQFFAGATLARLLVERSCSVLHIHFAHVPTQIGMYASMLSGVPFTVTAHANDIYQRPLLLSKKAERAQKFLTISDYNRRYLEQLGLPPEKLAVVRCGVSFSQRNWEEVEYIRVARGAPLLIGSLGRLVPKKGMATLLKAFALLLDNGVEAKLEIAGDGPLRNDLEQLAIELGINGKVRFLGALQHDQVAEWMQRVSVFALACRRDSLGDVDGIPVVLMEAISQAVPVVSTAVTGIPELVKDGETGRLVQPDDAEEIAGAIEALLADRETAGRLVSNGQALVREEFSQEVNIARLLGHLGLRETQ